MEPCNEILDDRLLRRRVNQLKLNYYVKLASTHLRNQWFMKEYMIYEIFVKISIKQLYIYIYTTFIMVDERV